MLRRHLEGLGYATYEAGNGREGLDLVESHDGFAIAFCDWVMPVMDGLEFLHHIRASSQYAEMPIIMITTEGGRESIRYALDSGANGYLVKPFTRTEIHTVLSKAFDPSA